MGGRRGGQPAGGLAAAQEGQARQLWGVKSAFSIAGHDMSYIEECEERANKGRQESRSGYKGRSTTGVHLLTKPL